METRPVEILVLSLMVLERKNLHPVENSQLEVLLHCAGRFFVYNFKLCFFVRVLRLNSGNLVAAFTSAVLTQSRFPAG